MKYKILILFCIGLCGCQSTRDIDVWPLVFYENDPVKQEKHVDLFTSIYSYNSNRDGTTHAFRPFFVGEFPEEEDTLRMMFFWPFIYYDKKPNDTHIWVLPFYNYRNRTDPVLGKRDFDWFFLPFFTFGGKDTDEGPYLLMGFWGNMKGLFGYDEIAFKPFPFYVTAKQGEYESKGYFWPFFRFGEGGGKKFQSYAFFYSDYEKDGFFRRRTYFWPFVHYNLEDLRKKHSTTEVMVWPFYGQAVSEVAASRIFLWPFFSYAYHDPKKYREYNLPWPFFKYRRGAGTDEFRIWPLYWDIDKRGPGTVEKDLILMWPFFWSTSSEYPTYKKESFYVLPFYWRHWRQGKEKDGKIETQTKVWPLLEHKKKEDGSVRVRALSPLFFEDYIPYGIEKAWLPFFTLFDYGTGTEGEKSFTFLGPMYMYNKKKDSTYHRVTMFSYKDVKNKEENWWRFSVLGGLFEYRWDQGEKGLRFFYLPHWPTWGSKNKERKK